MNRPSKGASSGKPEAVATAEKSRIPGCIRSLADSTVAITVHAKPGSKLSAITGAVSGLPPNLFVCLFVCFCFFLSFVFCSL